MHSLLAIARRGISAIAIAIAIGIVATAAQAQIVVDGTREPSYGSPIVVQTVQTEFGDAMPPGTTAGSELDAGYARIENGQLYIFLSGNLEPNINKLNIFIDSKPGGENVLSSTPEYDFSNLSTNLGGMTFDTGFGADYHLFARWGSATHSFAVDFINRGGGSSAQVPGSAGVGAPAVGLISTGSIAAGNVGTNASGSSLSQDLFFAIDHNNAFGVAGGTAAANPTAAAAVITGMEFSIALADLGNPAGGAEVRIAAMIGNGDQNFLSNQILGGLPAPQGNLGGDGSGNFTGTLSGIDFNNFAGLQYFSITVPVPGDFNGNGIVDLADYYLIYDAAIGGSGSLEFDLNGDGAVNFDDVPLWHPLCEAEPTCMLGDFNADLVRNCTDYDLLLAAFGGGPLALFDFDLNGEVQFADLLFWANNLCGPDPSCDGALCTGTSLGVKAFLEGPYSTADDRMRTGLVDGGVLPLSQPFSDPSYNGTVLDHDSTESVTAHRDSTVDWLLVDLRTGTDSASTISAATQAAVLYDDGTVATPGEDRLRFPGVSDGSYYLVLRSRNHLGIMTSAPIIVTAGVGAHDFTTAAVKAFGDGQNELETGVFGMFAGDGTQDGQVTAGDFNAWLVDTKAVSTGYLHSDHNLDTQVTASDFNLWLVNTKAVAESQVPD